MSFKIKNDCEGVDLVVYQHTLHPQAGTRIKSGETIAYAWSYPNRKKDLCVDFIVENSLRYHCKDKFSFDHLHDIMETEVPVSRTKKTKVFTAIKIEGKNRIMRFYNTKRKGSAALSLFRNAVKKVKEEIINMNIELSIKGIGLSLITTTIKKKRETRKEVIYLLLRGVEFRMVDSNLNRSAQLRIKFMNIDNNSTLDTSFPVLLTPTLPRDLDPETKEYFLDVLVHQKSFSTEVLYFDLI